VHPLSISPAVSAAIGRIDRNISFTSRSFQSQIDDSLVQERLIAMLSAFFGTLALVIAAVGLAGLVSYSVSRRRREMGIRAALGATPGSLIRLAMWDVLAITSGGLIFGVTLSFAGGRLVAGMLYLVSPRDPVTLIIASSMLISAAALVSYIPARRAARIDPMQCLRSD
jgi:ABC-type antimicrobial peptide transport system permease subunit